MTRNLENLVEILSLIEQFGCFGAENHQPESLVLARLPCSHMLHVITLRLFRLATL